jgi:hypothetical protein
LSFLHHSFIYLLYVLIYMKSKQVSIQQQKKLKDLNLDQKSSILKDMAAAAGGGGYSSVMSTNRKVRDYLLSVFC